MATFSPEPWIRHLEPLEKPEYRRFDDKCGIKISADCDYEISVETTATRMKTHTE